MTTNLFIVTWFTTGVIAAVFTHGFNIAYFWREYPILQCPERFAMLHRRHLLQSCLVILCPIALITLACGGFCKHGLMFKLPKP